MKGRPLPGFAWPLESAGATGRPLQPCGWLCLPTAIEPFGHPGLVEGILGQSGAASGRAVDRTAALLVEMIVPDFRFSGAENGRLLDRASR